MLEKLSLDGKGIVITGGGTGLGREMVLAIARAGGDLVIASRRAGPIEEVAALARETGRHAVAVPTDVTDTPQVEALFRRALGELGKVDVLINNAGIVRGAGATPIWEISDADWRLGIETNLSSAFYCSRAVAKHMVDRGRGKIINVSSGVRASRRPGQLHVHDRQGRGPAADAHPGDEPRQVRRHQHLHRARLHSDRGNGHAARDPTPGKVHPHRQGRASYRDRARRGVPRVGRLRLHERRGLCCGRGRSGGRICADGLRAGCAPDYLSGCPLPRADLQPRPAYRRYVQCRYRVNGTSQVRKP